jgi:hypothetical protein
MLAIEISSTFKLICKHIYPLRGFWSNPTELGGLGVDMGPPPFFIFFYVVTESIKINVFSSYYNSYRLTFIDSIISYKKDQINTVYLLNLLSFMIKKSVQVLGYVWSEISYRHFLGMRLFIIMFMFG